LASAELKRALIGRVGEFGRPRSLLRFPCCH
jgi:hypothetical protein